MGHTHVNRALDLADAGRQQVLADLLLQPFGERWLGAHEADQGFDGQGVAGDAGAGDGTL